MRALMEPDPCNMQDPDAVKDRYLWYLDKCEEFDDRPTVEGYALAMGYDRTYLYKVLHGEYKSIPVEVVNILKRVWVGLNQMMAQYMVDGHLNPVTAIFLLKNHFNYKDQTESVIIKKDPYETGDPEEIARRYLAGVAPALPESRPVAQEMPVVETVVVDQSGTVE